MLDRGQINHGFEPTNRNNNYPENRIWTRLWKDTEAPKLCRSDTIPNIKISAETVPPKFSRNTSESASNHFSGIETEPTVMIPDVDQQNSIRSYRDITQDPNVVRLFKL